MEKKLLLSTLAILISANIFIMYVPQIGVFRYPELLVAPLVLSLTMWFMTIRKRVPIGFSGIDLKLLLSLTPVFFISFVVFLVVSFNDEYKNISSILPSLFLSALFISLYEEIIFRGIALGSFLSIGMQRSIAVYISALIFSFSHMSFIQPIGVYTFFLLLNTFIMGVFLGYVYLRSKNIFIVISIHVLWDFTVFINQSLPINRFSNALTVVLLLVAILYFSWSIKKLRLEDLREIASEK